MSRVTKWNLILYGVECVAEHVSRALHADSGGFGVYVDTSGAVRVLSIARHRPDPRPVSELVGVYTRKAKIEHIEDDLLAHLRQLNAAHAA